MNDASEDWSFYNPSFFAVAETVHGLFASALIPIKEVCLEHENSCNGGERPFTFKLVSLLGHP